MRPFFLRAWVVTCLSVGLSVGPAKAASFSSTVQGITLSTHRSGQEWGDDEIVPTMQRIASTGANWVAIHPYAWIGKDGEVSFRVLDATDAPAWLERPITEAHRHGMKVLVKPHLGYWGSGFSWRGEIAFESREQWTRFFDSYREWILQLGRAAADADAFCVGTELDATLGHPAPWREMISELRRVFAGPLTYAANWADFERVGFWDALDAIGVQAYFPISEAKDPDEDELRAGWRDLRKRLSKYSAQQKRPILFTELGYNQSLRAASEPWRYEVDGSSANELQARCLRVALEEVEAEDSVLGVFLWKWFPEPHAVGRNFQLATPRMLEAIGRVWIRD